MQNEQQCREAFEEHVKKLHHGMHSLICNGHRHNQFASFKAGWDACPAAVPEITEAMVERALLAFLRERSAQMGEPFTRQHFDGLKAEQPESFDDDIVSMRCALEAALNGGE